MRILTNEETKVLLTKLHGYLGEALDQLLEGGEEGYVFRLIRDRVFFVTYALAKMCSNIPRQDLCSVGTLVGKFTRGGKFRLNISFLHTMSQYARNKVWLKTGGQMPFLYGNHAMKAHIARMTDDTPQYGPVCIYSLSDLPLGFGVAARGTLQLKELQPTAVVIFNQADTGEYLRTEDE